MGYVHLAAAVRMLFVAVAVLIFVINVVVIVVVVAAAAEFIVVGVCCGGHGCGVVGCVGAGVVVATT